MTLSTFLQVALSPLWVVVVGMVPAFVVGLILLRRKKAHQAMFVEPFTSLPLRPPGESLRLKIEELREKFDEEVTTIFLAGLLAAMMTLLSPVALRVPFGAGMLFFAIGVDRKSTRLNSSHTVISYAVFCLKKKK